MNRHRLIHRVAVASVIVTCTMTAMGRVTTQASIDPHQHLSIQQARVAPKRIPPSMLGAPMTFEGEQAAVFANEGWVAYMNEALTKSGFDRIPGCSERLKTESFSLVADCDGQLVFTSNMYRAVASTMKSPTKTIDVRTGDGLPVRDIVSSNARDIVDSSAIRRDAIAPLAQTRQEPATPMNVSNYAEAAGGYVDESVPAVLRAPVPQTRRR
jgi:hypothetical protein